MQPAGRTQTPPLSHYAQARHPQHSYSSSSESSYGRLHSHSRSESGTSQTNYDDGFLATPPPPRALMEEYARPDPHLNGSPPKSSASRRSTYAALRDPMTMHLLLEDAVDDSEDYEILTPEELKTLKKEQSFLARRIESAKKKLFLESRVHNTAKSLQRLDSKSDSKYNPRSSLGKRRSLGGSQTVNGFPSEDLSPMLKSCEDLAHSIWKLEKRQAELHDRRLRHTAGVFKLNYQTQAANTGTQQRSIEMNGHEDEDDDDDEDEPQFVSLDGMLDRAGAPRNMKPRLQALSVGLFDLISRSGPYSKAGYSEPPDADADADNELTYIEMGLNTFKGLHEGLTKYSEQSIDKVRRFEQMNAVVTGLWDIVVTGESDLKRSREATRGSSQGAPGVDGNASDEGGDEETEFSIQAFSSRVQRLCDRAATMSDDQEEQAKAHEADREDMEAEIIRLQTEVTIARAELDGAYGTRAQRALEGQADPEAQRGLEELIAKNSDLMQQKAEIEQRVDLLQKELREMVAEYESLMKQGVEAEKEREVLEGLVDSLKEHIEEVELKMGDEKLKAIGKRGSKSGSADIARAGETISTGVMKTEFKKVLRDVRASHFKTLKAEQEERRRLEAVVRTLRKEHSAASSSILSPPPHAKSNLSRSVAAP